MIRYEIVKAISIKEKKIYVVKNEEELEKKVLEDINKIRTGIKEKEDVWICIDIYEIERNVVPEGNIVTILFVGNVTQSGSGVI